MADPRLPPGPTFYQDGEPHMPPHRILAYACERQGITPDQLGVKPIVVASFFSQLTSYLVQETGAHLPTRLALGDAPGPREFFAVNDAICLTRLRMGAPAAVVACEEMIACGAKAFLIIGAAGTLQPDLPVGSVVLPETAIREEGTSHHYLPPEAPATATPALLDALQDACLKMNLDPRTGLHWTTDAPYREHKEKIAAYREGGVLSVDMEVLALYVLAEHRAVGCAAVVAISDELYEPWRIGYGTSEFQRSIMKCGLAALEAARALAERLP